MRISCSRAQLIATCGRQYYYRYEKRYVTVAKPFPLVFGTVIDKAVSGYVSNHALGKGFDILSCFNENFEKELSKYQIQYPQHWNAEIAREAGRKMCQDFPEVWDKSNLVVVFDQQGKPIVQRRIIAPLPQDHELEMILDAMVMDTLSGDIAVLDFKTTSAALSVESPFGANAFQLTSYQYGADFEFGDFFGPVKNIGFMEFVKRLPAKTAVGKGPTVEPPAFYARRSDEQVKDMFNTYLWSARDIAAKRFNRPTNGAYNSPCNMCDFARVCVHNDMQGITVRPARRAA